MSSKGNVTHLVVCVGCGGVLYHMLTQMSVWAKRRDSVLFLLIDDDVISEANGTRQWPNKEKMEKVEEAAGFLRNFGFSVRTVNRKVGTRNMLSTIVTEMVLNDFTVENLWVLALPDNHLARRECFEGAGIVHRTWKMDVKVITAGNTVDTGYAYGCYWTNESCYNNWLKRHPDILAEAKAEEDGKANPTPCNSVGETPEQSSDSNGWTAMCVMKLMEYMAWEQPVREVNWSVQDNNVVLVHERRYEVK